MDNTIPGKNERRRRIRRPLSLTVFGGLFLILPVLNYAMIAYRLQVGLNYPEHVFRSLNFAELALLLSSVPIGIGLLLVKKWGWWLFLLYSALLVSYNAFVFAAKPFAENLSALLFALFGLSSMAFFMRRDIAAPYFKLYPRGWRLEKRQPLVFEITVDGIVRRTRDAGVQGVYVDWPDCRLGPGAEVSVSFRLNEHSYEFRGGIVRVDPDGAGIAFRGAPTEIQERLRADLEAQG